MASSSEKCNFCDNDMNVPQKGWCLKDSTYAKLCIPCSSAFNEGTFCRQYHINEDGWRTCSECEREVHCGCIMALHTFEVNDASGMTCKECLGKKSLVVSNVISASSSVPSLKDCSQLHGSCSISENVTGVELLAYTSRSKPTNDDIQNPDKATAEGPNLDLIFLFEKTLTPSDCDLKAGRFLLPKLHAEKFIPLTAGQRKMPVVIKDSTGDAWDLMLRWWPNKKSRKFLLDGTRKCCQEMQWNVGDKSADASKLKTAQ